MFKQWISVVILSLFLVGCGSDETSSKEYLVKSQLLVEVDNATLGTTFGYKAYKIIYNTTYQNKSVEASGLLVLPTGYEQIEGFSLSMVCDAHGTIFNNNDTPTRNYLPNLNPIGAGFAATAGFITIQPDYVGFGESNATHPYMLKEPLADSSIDMIQAVIEFAQQNQLPINGQLFLSGYSEGGYVTMATLQDLEENYASTLRVLAAAPMAAPYNMDLLTQGVFGAEMMAFSPFAGYVAYSYANYYENISLDQLVDSPYLPLFPTLYDGSKSGTEIYMSLTNYTQELFTSTIISNYFSNPNEAFKVAMVENSIHNWTPKTKMRLYHCDGDNIIPFAFSEEAYANFKANGANDVELITLSGDDHSACASVAYPQVIEWFAYVRENQ
jgi:predicted esterase